MVASLVCPPPVVERQPTPTLDLRMTAYCLRPSNCKDEKAQGNGKDSTAFTVRPFGDSYCFHVFKDPRSALLGNERRFAATPKFNV
jgi:hypothetical protein